MKNQRLYFEGPFTCAVRKEDLPAANGDRLLVQVSCSAVSAGTEMLIFQGHFPAGMAVDTALPSYAGQHLAYPLTYGYSSVGTVVSAGPRADPAWIGQRVFAFQPHQGYFAAPAGDVIRVPAAIGEEDAAFLATMETAVNLVMDGRPVIGERVLVLGQGIVGLLTTALLTRFPLARLVVTERWPLRRQAALELGADAIWEGGGADGPEPAADAFPGSDGADLVFELSGQPAMLDTAIRCAGFDGRIVVGSWYGAKTAPVDLGGCFHRKRLRLISSQVSTLAPGFSGRWSKARRLATAWEQIARVRPSRLITHRFDIEDAQAAYEHVSERPEETLQVLLTYGASQK